MSIVLQGSTSGSITLQEPAVAGSTVLSLPATSGTLLTTATPFSNGQGPAFSAATAYNKSISNNTTTIITGYGTPTFDTASAFNTTTGRFQPTVAGYYAMFGMMDFGNNGIAAASSIACNISKNGILLYFGGYGSSSGTFACATANGIVYLNGSTDYVELGCFQNTGGTATGARGVFNGALIRAN